MANMPARVCAAGAQPNGAAAGHMFLLVLLLVSLLSSVIHARAEGPTAVANHLVTASVDSVTQGPSSTIWNVSASSACQNHGLPSVPCRSGSCCGAVCHAPADLAMAVELPAPARTVHSVPSVVPAAHDARSTDTFRPPIV